MMNVSRSERIQGGIYGALVGDALGVPVEFTSRVAARRSEARAAHSRLRPLSMAWAVGLS